MELSAIAGGLTGAQRQLREHPLMGWASTQRFPGWEVARIAEQAKARDLRPSGLNHERRLIPIESKVLPNHGRRHPVPLVTKVQRKCCGG